MENQKERILNLLRNSPTRTVSCREFADHFLFHKVASRCSELRGQGYDIRYIKGNTVMESKYELRFDKEFDAVKMQFDEVGQSSFA